MAKLAHAFFLSVLLSGCGSTPVDSGQRSLAAILSSYGYEQISPPSRIPSPGTIIRVIDKSPLSFNVVCSAGQAFGDAWLAGVISSDTVDASTREKLESKFSVGADYKKLVGASATADWVSDVTMKLTNPKLVLISSASARQGQANRSCLAATDFKGQMAAGEITMITSALQADVEYTVQFKKGASVSADAKAEMLRNIAAKVGGSVADSGGGTVKGTNLFWGVKRDPVVYLQYKDAHR